MYKYLIIYCIGVILFTACKPGEEDVFSDKVKYSTFDEIFNLNNKLEFWNGDNPYDLIAFSRLRFTTDKKMFYDSMKKAVMVFDNNNNLITQVGERGKGPGEYQIPTHILFDKNDNIHVFDLAKRELIRYSEKKEYTYEDSEYILNNPVRIVLNKNLSKFYLSYNTTELLHFINTNNESVFSRLEFEDDNLRIFNGRFAYGGLCSDSLGGCWIAHPENYKIINFDAEGNIKRAFTSNMDKYFPVFEKFPHNLNPYDYSPAHSKYMDSNLHIFSMENILNKYLFVLLDKTIEARSIHFYLNIHTFNGETIAKGIQIPDSLKYLTCYKDKFYFQKRLVVMDNGELSNPEILEYTLNPSFGN